MPNGFPSAPRSDRRRGGDFALVTSIAPAFYNASKSAIAGQVMAGHSQFKNIMHRKGRQDKVRSKLFGKLAREITTAAKLGLPDPAMNPRLRAAIIEARGENMTKDVIER